MVNLRIVRLANGLTQEEVAREIGVKSNALCQWELGQREPDFVSLVKLADFFGVSVDYLLDREKPVNSDNRLFPIIRKVSKIDNSLLTELDTFIDALLKKQANK